LKVAEYLRECNDFRRSAPVEHVTKAKVPKVGSLIYDMKNKPRGKCVIINNFVGGQQRLDLESIKFKSIFEQLFFDVTLLNNKTASQIRDELILTKNAITKESDALVVMIIAHGQDEHILGFGESDSIRISHIVNIFSTQTCENLNRTPTLFIFNCCRISMNLELPMHKKLRTQITPF